jgi:hypothetical protein
MQPVLKSWVPSQKTSSINQDAVYVNLMHNVKRGGYAGEDTPPGEYTVAFRNLWSLNWRELGWE